MSHEAFEKTIAAMKKNASAGIGNRAKNNKGKTYEEIYGEDRAKQVKSKQSFWSSNLNPRNRSVNIDDINYSTISEASKKTGISKYLIRKKYL